MTAYTLVDGWLATRPEWTTVEVPGVAVAPDDTVYVLVRGDPPVRVHARDGTLLAAWGSGLFTRPHSISLGAGGSVYVVDDLGHAVHRFSPDGALQQTFARQGTEADYEAGSGPGTRGAVTRGAPPFNFPTWVAEAPDGGLYVTDGYGNARLHRFGADGELLASWGEPGSGPVEFELPHGVTWHEGRLLVSDRFNDRVQLLDPDGGYQGELEARFPNSVAFRRDGAMLVAELGHVWVTGSPDPAAARPRVTLRDPAGEVQSELGGAADDLCFAPHAVAVDSQGDVYVGEVTRAHTKGQAPEDATIFRKYAAG